MANWRVAWHWDKLTQSDLQRWTVIEVCVCACRTWMRLCRREIAKSPNTWTGTEEEEEEGAGEEREWKRGMKGKKSLKRKWESEGVCVLKEECMDHNLKSVSVRDQYSLPLSLCHSHIPFPSRSHAHPSLQLRINFSVSIWLVPSALLSSSLSHSFSHFFATFLTSHVYIFFLFPLTVFLPLWICFLVIARMPLVHTKCSCWCVWVSVFSCLVLVYSVGAICLLCLLVSEW